MTDTSTTTDSETKSATSSPVVDGVLDLRPPVESVKRELCRLGLAWSSTDPDGTEAWRDYNRGILASFPPDGSQVTLRDIKTNIAQTLTLTQLKTVERIDTMTMAGGEAQA